MLLTFSAHSHVVHLRLPWSLLPCLVLSAMGEETEPRYRVGCFLCKHQIQFDDPEDFTVEFASFEVHLVSSHKVIIPKFANWEEFSRFYSSIESLEQLQQSDRCSPFIMSRFDNLH